MKIIFQTEREVLKELDDSEMNAEMADELEETFNHRKVKKYEITFTKDVCVEQIHDLSKVQDEQIELIKITIE